MAQWMRLWSLCHVAGMSGPQRIGWPDGGPLLEQPNLTTEIFSLITEQVTAEAQVKAG